MHWATAGVGRKENIYAIFSTETLAECSCACVGDSKDPTGTLEALITLFIVLQNNRDFPKKISQTEETDQGKERGLTFTPP